MHPIRFKTFGNPSVLEVEEIATPAIGETTALVRTMAASINPSGVKNVAGAMKQTTLPRTPGRDYAGVVEAGPAEWIGAAVSSPASSEWYWGSKRSTWRSAVSRHRLRLLSSAPWIDDNSTIRLKSRRRFLPGE